MHKINGMEKKIGSKSTKQYWKENQKIRKSDNHVIKREGDIE